MSMMLVHAFTEAAAWFDEFAAFSCAVGIVMGHPGVVSAPKLGGNVAMRWDGYG
jgi:hypothetical protein